MNSSELKSLRKLSWFECLEIQGLILTWRSAQQKYLFSCLLYCCIWSYWFTIFCSWSLSSSRFSSSATFSISPPPCLFPCLLPASSSVQILTSQHMGSLVEHSSSSHALWLPCVFLGGVLQQTSSCTHCRPRPWGSSAQTWGCWGRAWTFPAAASAGAGIWQEL